MNKIISVSLQKGGVGKSTTSQALASILGKKKNKVLLIDMDSQGNLSYSCDVENAENTIYEVLIGDCDMSEAIIEKKYYDIVPANRTLTNIPLQFEASENQLLKKKLDKIRENYDFIIIDTPPALGLLSINALAASDYVLVPMESSSYALQGLGELFDTVEAVKRINKGLNVLGILLVKYNGRTILSRQIREMIVEYAISREVKLFDTSIRESVVVREAQTMQENLIDYAPKSKPANEYKKFVDEMLKELDLNESK